MDFDLCSCFDLRYVFIKLRYVFIKLRYLSMLRRSRKVSRCTPAGGSARSTAAGGGSSSAIWPRWRHAGGRQREYATSSASGGGSSSASRPWWRHAGRQQREETPSGPRIPNRRRYVPSYSYPTLSIKSKYAQ